MIRPELLRVLLVGFMGSGKTTVGRRVAGALGWRFIDFDEAVEAEAGTSIAALFATEGEARFRALEDEVARRLLRDRGVVLASGGGWAAASGRLSGVPDGTATFWLRVSAAEAVSRASSAPDSRPLLAGRDALARAGQLLEERAAFYRAADWSVDTDHSSVEDVSARILQILAEEYPRAGEE